MSQDGNSDHTKSWAYKQMSKEQRKSHDSGRNGGDNYRSRNGNGGYINGGFRPDNHSSTTQDKNGNSSSQGKSWYKR